MQYEQRENEQKINSLRDLYVYEKKKKKTNERFNILVIQILVRIEITVLCLTAMESNHKSITET